MTAILAVDTSVAIAAVVRSHEAHTRARSLLAENPRIPAHALVESFSVLTRLPAPLRVRGPVAADVLGRAFPVVLTLKEKDQRDLLPALAAAGLVGGAVYDGLVAVTARQAGARLCTRDQRARSTYQALGVEVQWLGHGAGPTPVTP